MRITSTYVENTYQNHQDKNMFQDHLHIRGEYSEAIRPTGKDSGSPPHTWRILCESEQRQRSLRITSTYVENTDDIWLDDATKQDHLHIRGEYLQVSIIVFSYLGSPPHTWRIQCFVNSFSVIFGITSTYVENTVNKSLYSAK